MANAYVEIAISELPEDLQEEIQTKGIFLSRLCLKVLQFASEERQKEIVKLAMLRALALKLGEDLAPIDKAFPSTGISDALIASAACMANERPQLLFFGTVALVAQTLIGAYLIARPYFQ